MATDAVAVRPRTGPEHAIRVAKHTVPHKLAGAIQQALARSDGCDVMAMGAEATSRAVVGIALASGYLATRALSTTSRIYLTSTPSSNGDRPLSGVLFRLTKVPLA
jgi:stage V sporulation protein SpoVS